MKTFLSVVAMAAVLSACGSGGDDNKEKKASGSGLDGSPLTVTKENSQQAAKTALVGAERSVRFLDGEIFPPDDDSDDEDDLESKAPLSIIKKLDLSAALLKGAPEQVDCEAGGSFTTDFPYYTNQDVRDVPDSGEAFLEYDDCNFGEEVDFLVFNGRIDIKWSGGVNSEGDFKHYTLTFTVNSDGTDYTGTLVCSNYSETCEYSEQYAEEGVDYRIQNVDISGDAFFGYDIKATVYSGESYLRMAGTGLVPCDDGGFERGEINVTDATGDVVLEVSFDNCETMLVTFDGESERVAQ